MADVGDDDRLLRRIFDREDYLEWHDDLGRFVPSLAGVRFDPDGMSVFVERMLNDRGRSRNDVATIGGTKAAELVFGMRAGDARVLTFDVAHSANDETPIGFAHASVMPPDGQSKPERAMRTDLAMLMTCLVGTPSIQPPPP